MSLFLGKIHYWLFNKVLWFQGLEDEIIEFAKTKGLDIDNLKSKINLKYGEKLPNKNLEDMIDTSNIHGWLQSKIHSAEGRMAAWTREILSNDQDFILDMKKIYNKQGINAAKEAKVKFSIITAEDIFNSMNDYILDGMPCDRVNEILESNEDIVSWKRRICVHKDIWNDEVELFYQLRSLWIKSFINTVNNEFKYVEDDGVNKIERVQ